MVPFGVSFWPTYYGPALIGPMPGIGVPPVPPVNFEPFTQNPIVPLPILPNGSGAANPGLTARPQRPNPARAGQFVTFGDRLFRARNFKRATERYEQAIKADPKSATPRVRLAQIAIVHGQYTEAANRLREAQATQPDWLANAPDIEGVYAEPADFHAQIANLEAHLQAHPRDRDAWLVLGAEWYLSGRTKQAADVFFRLTDRKADPTLAAFLAATTPEALAGRQPDQAAPRP